MRKGFLLSITGKYSAPHPNFGNEICASPEGEAAGGSLKFFCLSLASG